MPILSSVAAAIVATIQAGVKSDDKQEDGNFLALLEGGDAAPQTNLAGEQALMDSVASKSQLATPADSLRAPPSQNNSSSAPAPQARDNSDKKSAPKDAVEKSDKPEAPQDKSQTAPRKESADKNTKADDSAKPPVIKSASKPAKTDDEESDTDELSRTLRAKIEDLSDLLSTLASVMGLSGAVSQTVIQFTQVTKITSVSLVSANQGLQGEQPVLDVSDRFAQLMAAITASQNLPSDVSKGMGSMMTSFQQLLTYFATNDGAQTGTENAALQTSITAADLSVTTMLALAPKAAESPSIDVNALSDSLKQLSQWLTQFRNLTNTAPTPDKLYVSDVSEDDQSVALIASTLAVKPQTAAASPIQAVNNVAQQAVAIDTVPQVKQDAPVDTTQIPAATLNAAQVAPATAPVMTSNTASIPAIEQGASSNGGGSSGGNQSGQNSGFAQISTASATGAGTATSTAAASNTTFSKMLKNTTSAPVAEQVVFNIKTAVKDGASKIQIQLDPVELGRLHIKMDISSDGKASGIVITADNRATLDLLQRDARALENALADAGIKTDAGSLSFNLRGGDQGQQQEARQNASTYTSPLPQEDELAPLAVISNNYVVNVNDGLDIHI